MVQKERIDLLDGRIVGKIQVHFKNVDAFRDHFATRRGLLPSSSADTIQVVGLNITAFVAGKYLQNS
jgi:hypothetical protein